MCLAIPARILSIHDTHAWVDIMDVRQKVNILLLIDPPVPGEYVLVHAGFAIEKIDLAYFHFLSDTLYEMLEGKIDE